jgi:hypothetical protein
MSETIKIGNFGLTSDKVSKLSIFGSKSTITSQKYREKVLIEKKFI